MLCLFVGRPKRVRGQLDHDRAVAAAFRQLQLQSGVSAKHRFTAANVQLVATTLLLQMAQTGGQFCCQKSHFATTKLQLQESQQVYTAAANAIYGVKA